LKGEKIMKKKFRSTAALALTLFLFLFHTFGFGGFDHAETTSPDYGVSTLSFFPDGRVTPHKN